MNSMYTQLTKNLEYLKLNQMKEHLDEVIDFVTTNNLSFAEELTKLTSYEIDFKEANMIRSMVKVGAFPHHNELNHLDDRLKHYCKYKLLIIDELGYLPIDKEDSKLFFRLIDMRYFISSKYC